MGLPWTINSAFNAVLTVAACVIVTVAAEPLTPVDQLLPLFGAIVALSAGFLWRSRLSVPVLSLVLLLISARLGIESESLRLLSYGLVTAGALFTHAAVVTMRGSLPIRDALFLLLSAGVVLRFAGAASDLWWRHSATLLGACLLLAALTEAFETKEEGNERERRVSCVSLAIALIACVITPAHPVIAVSFPLLLAAAVWFTRQRSPQGAILLILTAALCGRWGALMALCILAGTFTRRLFMRSSPGSPMLAWPVVSHFFFSLTTPLRFVLGFPFALRLGVELEILIPSFLLLVLSFVVRPQLAFFFLLAAAALLASSIRRPVNTGASLAVTAAFLVTIVAFFSWSGAFRAAFPLPLSLLAIASVAAIMAVPFLPGRLSSLAPFLAAAIFLVGAGGEPPKISQDLESSLAAGESALIPLSRSTRHLTLGAMGINLSSLREGSPVGRIELVDGAGRGFGREVTVGELSDWGAYRDEQVFANWNPVPRLPDGPVTGLGSSAWLEGVGLIPIRHHLPITALRVTGSSSLTRGARLRLTAIHIHD